MTKETEKISRTVETEITKRVICDWCHEEIPSDDPAQRDGRHESHIRFTTAYQNYGSDGGYREGWQVPDLCQPCGDKLRALLEENGITVQPIDEDW